MPVVNDVHSRLNPTTVPEVLRPETTEELRAIVAMAVARGQSLAVCGGRHAMGGQQFASGHALIDTSSLNRPIALDARRGLLTIEAGANWQQIIRATHDLQPGGISWAVRQKQTGADSLSLGGSIACNAHGRGLRFPPLINDIESLDLITPDADLISVSRTSHADLFPLVVGGYGLFGIIARATLRLTPRRKLRRVVDIIDLDDATSAFWRRIDQGCLYGDFQYAIDPSDDSFLRRGVMACYQPVPDDTPIDSADAGLPKDAWLELLTLAHRDPREAFRRYSLHYLASHGRVYWSDTMQLSTYIPTYSSWVEASLRDADPHPHAPSHSIGAARRRSVPRPHPDRSLMITELYVPPGELNTFMAHARRILRQSGVQDIYGTIRAIRKDTESFLPWAKDDSACIIFNLLTEHTSAGIERTRKACRALIDAAADLGGSFYLTYHRWASREQLLRCHPRLPEFLKHKERHDPRHVFESDWHRHLRRTLHGTGLTPPGTRSCSSSLPRPAVPSFPGSPRTQS
ncbi:MAG: FAD-binding oxidoreductase [Phycisphaeraceae bacterium]|nr:FAD-binding oxidoreductase [Phycisphaeraceae bacterium]